MSTNLQVAEQEKPASSDRVVVNRERPLEDEINRLVDRIDVRAQKKGLNKAYALDVLNNVKEVAQSAPEFAPVIETIKKEIRDAQLWTKMLQGMLEDVEASKDQCDRNKLFGEEWWQQQRAILQQVFQKDASEGSRARKKLYVQALLAWELEVCKKLVEEPFPDDDNMRKGTQALLEEKYEDTFVLLNHLIEGSSDGSKEPLITPEQHALLEIFKGRIYLYRAHKPDDAHRLFQWAKELTPKSGRPYAALYEYSQGEGLYDEADIWAEQAVGLSPDLPEGYVALGLCAESEGRLNDAIEFHTQAVDKVWKEKDPYRALARLLAPVSSNLWLCLAQRLLEEEYPQAALTVTEQAFKLGADKELRAQKLQARILLALGKTKEAADIFVNAGLEQYKLNELQEAIALFKLANEILPKYQPTYWYLMDALRMSTYDPGLSVPSEKLLEEALEIWDKGVAISLPNADYSWAYLGRALINEQRAMFLDVARSELWWEAVAYIERGLLLYEYEPARWAYLSRFYRYLRCDSNALESSSEALVYDPENGSALEERALIVVSLDEIEEASEVIEKRLLTAPDDLWTNGVKAYLYVQQDKYSEALELLNRIITPSLNDLWYFDLRALCYRLLNNSDAAQSEYAFIRDKAKLQQELSPTDMILNASAAYQLGEIDEAIEIFKPLLEDPTEADEANRSLGLCYLVKSDSLDGPARISKLKEARRCIYKGISLTTLSRKLDDFVKVDLGQLEQKFPAWSNDADYSRTMALIKRRLRERRKKLVPRPSAEEELKRVVSERESKNDTNSWAWVAAKAGLARIKGKNKQWVEAAEAYRSLKTQQKRFPEAQNGLESAIAKLVSEGERYLKESKPADSVTVFKQALVFDSELSYDRRSNLRQQLGDGLLKDNRPAEALIQFNQADDLLVRMAASKALGETRATIFRALKWAASLFKGKNGDTQTSEQYAIKDDEIRKRRADLYVRLSFTHFLMKNQEGARKAIRSALEYYGASGNAAESIGTICRSLISDVDQYWTLDAELTAFIESVTTEESLKTDLAKARESVAAYLSDFFELSDQQGTSTQMLPVTTPIVLEIFGDLLPSDPESNSQIFKTYLPQIRTRIYDEMGVRLPGVRVRATDERSKHNRYSILLDEVYVDTGMIEPEMRYSPVSPNKLREIGVPDEGFIETAHPVTGAAGCWVRESAWSTIIENRVELWDDPLLYMVCHLEEVLRANLAGFLGTQEVHNLLEEWSQDTTGEKLVSMLLPDHTSRLRFGRVLRALIKERVPLRQWKEILETIHDIGLPDDDVCEAVRMVRLRLKQFLPGNTPNMQRTNLPGETERMLERYWQHQDGKTFIAVPPDTVQDFLAEVRSLIDGNQENQVLVVQSSQLRPFIRRIVRFEFPKLIVLALEELTSPNDVNYAVQA